MQLQDTIQLRGSLEIVLRNAVSGEVVERQSIKNTIVTAGRKWILQKLLSSDVSGAQTTPLQYMAIGTSTTAPATSDSALGSETTRKAIQTFTTSNLTSNPPSYQLEVSFATNEGNTTLAEVGLLNSSSGGTMLARATYGTINKTTSNTLSISYTISG